MSGYLRDIALRKQLEEKVKEATKNRQQAEKEFTETKEIIESCRSIDAEIAEAEKALAEATSAMSAKDYKLALDKSLLAKEKAKKAYAERAAAIVESSAVLLGLAKNMGAKVPEGETAVNKSREALSKEDYETAIDIAKKSWKRFEKIVNEHLSESFSNAQSLIVTAKDLGKDTGPAEDLLSRARSAVETHDFELALSYTNECFEIIQAELVEEVNRATEEVEVLLKTAQELDLDVSKMSSLIERSKADAKKLDFQKALNALKQGKTEGEKALQKGLDILLSDTKSLLKVAEEMGADISKGKALTEQSSVALQEGNFQQASELSKQAVQEIQAAQFQKVLFTIAQSRDKFVAAKNIGADIGPAMEALNKARQALQSGKFIEALNEAKQAETQVEDSLKEFREVETLVKELSKDFTEAESLGVNVTTARRFLERAKKDLNAKDFKAALEEVRKTREELSRTEYEKAMEAMEHTELTMTLGERMNANLDEAGKLLEDCIVATKDKKYREAIELAQSASQIAETSIKNQLTDDLANLRGSIGFMAEDAANVRSLVDKAEGALAAKDFDSAFTFVSEARKFVEGKTKLNADEFHAMLKSAVELGAELGSPVGTLAELFKEVDASLEDGDFSKIAALRKKNIGDITEVAESIFNIVKGKLIEARSLKINIESLLQILKRARMALSIGDLKEAFRLMSDCKDKTARLVLKHKETYNALSSAAALVAEARKKDVDVTSALEMLLQAKKSFENLDYERALELSRRAKAETEKLMILYTSAQNIIATKEKLEIANKLGVDTSNLKDALEMAKGAMKKNAYDEALALSTKTRETIDELLETKINSLISQSESIFETLKDVTMTEQLDKIARAKELMEKREWADAGELALAVREDLEGSIKRKDEAILAVKKCQDLVSEVEALNIEVPGTKKLLEKAERAMKSGSFDEAIDLSGICTKELEKERDANINKTIERFEETIKKAKHEGIDTRSAEKLLDKARTQFREKKYRQAIALAMQSEAEAERIGLQQDMAAKAMMTAEKKLKTLTTPIPEITKMIDDAKKAFEEGDYVRALDLAIRAGDGFNKYRGLLDETSEIRSKAEKITKTAQMIGSDASKLEKILQEANSAMESGNTMAARDAYQQCLEWGLGVCKSHLENLRNEVNVYTNSLKNLKLDATQITKRLIESKAHLDSENFEVAYNLMEEAKRKAQEMLARKVAEAMVTSEEAIAHAKKLHADVNDAEKLLEQGREALENGEFEKALKLINDSVGQVESRRDSEKKFIDFSYKADSTIRNARKYGIEVIEAEKALTEALELKKKDIDKATKTAETAFKLATDAVDAFTPSIEANLDVSKAKKGQWADATLTLKNVGKALAKDIDVRMLGDIDVEGLKEITSLRAKGETTIPLKVKMTASGAVPIAIHVISHRLLDGKDYSEEIIVQVEVSDKIEPPKPLVAQKESRCLICKGSIKVGFRIARCTSCGKEFHEMCASRAKLCPACQTEFPVVS